MTTPPCVQPPRAPSRSWPRAQRSFGLAWPVLFALLLIHLAPLAVVAQGPGAVRGEVRSAGNGRALAGATVEVRAGGWTGGAATDADGHYLLRDVPPGRTVLRVRYLGHSTLELEVLVPAGREVTIDLTLPLEPVVLAPVTVEGNTSRFGADSIPAREPGLGLARARALDAGPGLAELGVVDAVRGLPDREPTEPGSMLYVRGAAADLKLVYLDGAPVYAPFPLGGLLDPFTPGLLQSAEIYLGGAPARFDGGLSYVMDLRTRAGRADGIHTTGSLDLLSARMLAEGGLGERVTVLASGRALHPLATSGLFGDALPYDYREGLIRVDARLGATGLLSFTGFANDEAVRLGDVPPADGAIEWGNTSGALRYRGTLRETSLDLSASVGAYEARLPILGTRPLTAGGWARRSRLTADFGRRFDQIQLRFGGSLEHQEHHASATEPGAGAVSGVLEGFGTVGGVYGEGVGHLGDRVLLRAGGRVDSFSSRSGPTLAPRVAATLLVTERAALTVAVGRYHQFLRPPDEVLLQQPELLRSVERTTLTVGRASHFTVALDHELAEGTRLGVEAFFKDFSDVPGSYSVESNASGADLWVRRETGSWTGWLGYSLAWAWSSPAHQRGADFTGRHLLSTGLGGPILENARLDVRFAYGAGLPYAAIPLRADFETAAPGTYATPASTLATAHRGGTESAPLLHNPQEPFLRLDASLSQTWNPRLGDRRYEITPYLRLLNGLAQRDALFYYFDHNRDESPRPIGSLPVVPILGVEWKF